MCSCSEWLWYKVSDVALVSDIGGHTVEAKAEVQDSISLVDGRGRYGSEKARFVESRLF